MSKTTEPLSFAFTVPRSRVRSCKFDVCFFSCEFINFSSASLSGQYGFAINRC
jgi:hypothetical protein